MVSNLIGLVNFKGVSTPSAVQQKKPQETDAPQQPAQTQQAYSAENVRAYGTTGLQTTLATEEAQKKYAEISAILEPETRVALSGLLKSGTLLNNNSNDGSSVLDNLHKMATEPRIRGLNPKTLVTEAIATVANPSVITQKFEDIPEHVERAVHRHPELGVRSASEMDIGDGSNTCVAASIEYGLASTRPAEFVRMAAGLSSEDYSVTKNIPLSDIAPERDDALWLLDKFELPHTIDENDNVTVKISPDRNAIIRARVQMSHRDEGERSSIDVLMQSAFMNVGSAQTYNALNDTRKPSDGIMGSGDTTGLSRFEAAFTEGLVINHPKDIVVCQAIQQGDGRLLPIFGEYNEDSVAASIQAKTDAVMQDQLQGMSAEEKLAVMPQVMPAIVKATVEDVLQASLSSDFDESIAAITHFQAQTELTDHPVESAEEFMNVSAPEIMQNSARKVVQTLSQEIIGKSIVEALHRGENVMIGYLPHIDEVHGIYLEGGHEMNIVDVVEGLQGEPIFMCKDTMNDDEPIGISADYLLQRLDHVSLPQDIIDYDHMATMLSSVGFFRQTLDA